MMKRILTGLVFVTAAILLMLVIAVARGTLARAVEPEEPIKLGYLLIRAREPEPEKPVHDKRTVNKTAVRVKIQAEEPETVKEPEPYTDEELELLACVIYCEAGSDSISNETRRMVGEVVLNRVASEQYPDTIKEVLTQKGQYGRFHWTGVVWPTRASKSVEAHAVERAYECAVACFTEDRLLPTDTIYQAGFVQGREVVAQAPGFYFCR